LNKKRNGYGEGTGKKKKKKQERLRHQKKKKKEATVTIRGRTKGDRVDMWEKVEREQGHIEELGQREGRGGGWWGKYNFLA